MPKPWTTEQVQTLRKLYPDHSCAEIGQIVGHSRNSVSGKAWTLGLKKDKKWRLEKLAQTQFRAGQVPPNKGKTWDQLFTPEQQERIRKNLFKPGCRPITTKPLGHERKDKNGYWWIKVAEPNVFKLKHRLLWEQHYGPIPEGINISFIDGNSDNVTIENLKAETMLERFNRCCNIHTTMPPELRELVILKGQLKRQINKKENKGNERSD